MTRANRAVRILLAGCCAGAALAGCTKGVNADRAAALAAVANTMGSGYDFVFNDTDLVGTDTVAGQVDDSYRYRLLLSVDQAPVWEMVVRDDAVADYFPDRAAVLTYSGSGYAPEDDLPIIFNELRSLIPPAEQRSLEMIYRQATLPQVSPAASLALAALRAGKWVLDPTGAPALPTLGGEAVGERATPFYVPLVLLQQVQSYLQAAPPGAVVRYSADSTTPAYKPNDDPFPPPGPGVIRYDMVEDPLPGPQLGSASGLPPPPANADFRKVAIYVKDNRVVALRVDYDILDRLAKVAASYRIPLQLQRSAGAQLEEATGQLLVDSLQGQNQTPFRVHELTMLFSYPAQLTSIQLPTPAVTAPLAGVLPEQGSSTTLTAG